MKLCSLVWTAILLFQFSLQAIAGVIRDSRGMASRNPQLGFEKSTSLGVKLVRKRSASLELEGKSWVSQSNKEGSHQYLSVESIPGEEGFLGTENEGQYIPALRGYGIFNTDTYSCDVILSRSCQKPSDCDGCLGLFTCKMSEGKCDFKGVSRSEALFYQSI